MDDLLVKHKKSVYGCHIRNIFMGALPFETIKLNDKIITWVDSIKHLGNYFDTTLSDKN